MPIAGLRKIKPFPQIGNIRKGKKEIGKREDGTEYEYPVDLKYFRVVFNDGENETSTLFNNIYGAMPTDLNVLVPFNEIDRFWSSWYEGYQAGRLIARAGSIFSANENHFEYLYQDGEIRVRNGLDVKSRQSVLFDRDKPVGQTKSGKPIMAKPIGRLHVVIPELRRVATLLLTTGSFEDIENLESQLNSLREINMGVIAGIPLVLKRRPFLKAIRKEDGTIMKVTRWMLSIEADERWVKPRLEAMMAAALPDGSKYESLLLPDPYAQPIEPTNRPAAEQVIEGQAEEIAIDETDDDESYLELQEELHTIQKNMTAENAATIVIDGKAIGKMETGEIDNYIDAFTGIILSGEADENEIRPMTVKLAALYQVRNAAEG